MADFELGDCENHRSGALGEKPTPVSANAAKNILGAGLAVSTRGGTPDYGPSEARVTIVAQVIGEIAFGEGGGSQLRHKYADAIELDELFEN